MLGQWRWFWANTMMHTAHTIRLGVLRINWGLLGKVDTPDSLSSELSFYLPVPFTPFSCHFLVKPILICSFYFCHSWDKSIVNQEINKAIAKTRDTGYLSPVRLSVMTWWLDPMDTIKESPVLVMHAEILYQICCST